jgi:hypothetical protein
MALIKKKYNSMINTDKFHGIIKLLLKQKITEENKLGISIKKWTETPGNCFSCKHMKEFTIPGRFKCSIFTPEKDNAFLMDDNTPPKTACQCWNEKAGQSYFEKMGRVFHSGRIDRPYYFDGIVRGLKNV